MHVYSEHREKEYISFTISRVVGLIQYSKEFESEWGVLGRVFKIINDLTSVEAALHQYQRAENCPATGVS